MAKQRTVQNKINKCNKCMVFFCNHQHIHATCTNWLRLPHRPRLISHVMQPNLSDERTKGIWILTDGKSKCQLYSSAAPILTKCCFLHHQFHTINFLYRPSRVSALPHSRGMRHEIAEVGLSPLHGQASSGPGQVS